MDKTKVSFISTYNSARSQMAEESLNHPGRESFQASRVGLEQFLADSPAKIGGIP